jgi:hypothetical protein
MPAGSATFTNTNASSLVRVIRIAWTADTSGVVAITSGSALYSGVVVGAFLKLGTPTPSNNYTVVIKDQHGIDLLDGVARTGVSNTTDHQFTATDIGGGVAFADSYLELLINNAGNVAQGEVILYLI